MKKIIKFVLHNSSLEEYLLIDNHNLVFKKNKEEGKKTSRVAYYQTEEDEVVISYDNFHPYFAKAWWIKEMLFFIISIFGIFDSRKHKSRRNYIHYEAKVRLDNLKKNEIEISNSTDDTKGLEIKTDLEVDEVSNIKEKNLKLKKRKGLLNLSKILFIIAALVAAALIIYFNVR